MWYRGTASGCKLSKRMKERIIVAYSTTPIVTREIQAGMLKGEPFILLYKKSRGCDKGKQCDGEYRMMFQSAHPEGGRPSATGLSSSLGRFQSTHPHEGRLIMYYLEHQNQIFQSTHPCGVRRLTSSREGMRGAFQSTHPCGVRPPSNAILGEFY